MWATAANRPERTLPRKTADYGFQTGRVVQDGDTQPGPYEFRTAQPKGQNPMADLGGMADKAKDAAKDHPEKVDQAKDKVKDTVDGHKDDQK